MQINIPNPIADTVDEWAKYLRQLHQNPENALRKRNSKEVVDYYSNKQRPYLDSEFANIYSDPISRQFKRKGTINMTKQIVDALAQVYHSKVDRTIKGKKAVLKKIQQPLFESLNKDMSQLEKRLISERSVLLGSVWSPEKSRIIYQSYHQFEFDVVIDDINNRTLIGAILSDYTENVFSDNRKSIVFTANNTYEFSGSQLIRRVNHNLGILPFILVHAENPGFEDYLDCDIELAKANLELNVLYSHLLNMCQTQAHGILVMTLPAEYQVPHDDDSNANLSEGNAPVERDTRLALNDTAKSLLVMRYGENPAEEPKLEAVQYEANIKGVLEALSQVRSDLGSSYGVEIGQMGLSVTAQPQTATSVWVTETRRRNIIKEKRNLLIEAERDIFNIAYKQYKLLVNNDLPEIESNLLNIEYTDEKSLLEGADIKDLVLLRKEGDMLLEDLLKELYPTLSDEEIAQKALQINEEVKNNQNLVPDRNKAPK